MDFDNLLGNCATLENTISILVKSNATKELELVRLRNYINETTHQHLDEATNREQELQQELDSLKFKKYEIDTEIRQLSEVNQKLSELVSITQMSDTPESQADVCKYNELYYNIINTITDYEQIKIEFSKLLQRIEQVSQACDNDKLEVKDLIKENQELLVQIHKYDCIIRLSSQQNKYAEQQFDLILNQLPWEPLTGSYIDELRNSNWAAVRDLAEVLQIQAGEIEDLNDSINSKKQKKLDLLEGLHSELNTFLRKREEAVLLANLYD